MKKVDFSFQKRLERRAILRGTGVAMALPLLGAMKPSFAKGAGGEEYVKFNPCPCIYDISKGITFK